MQRHLLDPVFEGVNRAYFAVPTSQDRVKVTKAFVDACFDHGVEHAVIVSVIGADTRDTVFHQQFKEIEDYVLGRADKPVRLKVGDKGQVRFRPVILRCAMFYQNIYSFVPVLKDGHLYLPLRDGSLGHVDMEDVGACIAEILVGPERFDKRTYNLVGEYQRGNIMASAISMGARVHCTYENVEPDVVIQSLKVTTRATCLVVVTRDIAQPRAALRLADVRFFFLK
ncbi:hypothetical protein PTSG_03680 [Salpingoeca rosetta]|uniref:NmrA-like domain-containing protein n=1 Tax=Salpingoeca rosetta (strain ATCC 50818 / BSB-021) TaxID=946362 RepID=F2U6A1_SALR5|nr:uncharacterized protein PTSG_03680 [Salpingoeca rosetta]EGD83042.1 hypothetical protein PTSG_03680 [Salpingoeca rosetta]|eukprot:XP_004995406.1 hypothetical protein PTSG_03680 [Salpingoeca rosetta]